MTAASPMPPASAPISWDADLAREEVVRLSGLDGPLLPVLHALSERFGYLPAEAVPLVAEVLNLSRAEVQGVVSFYHDFRQSPAGRHRVKLCRAEACQAMGADALYAAVEARCGDPEAVTLEPVYCLGNCALSPAGLIDGKLYGRLDLDRTLALVEER